MLQYRTKNLFTFMALAAGVELFVWQPAAQAQLARFVGPLSSQPLALSSDNSVLAVANPDNNSVSFFDVRPGKNIKLKEVKVQKEPNGVAFTPDGKKLFVANTVSGTVSVIPVNVAARTFGVPQAHLPVGTEPYSLAITPNGTKLYVANARSDSVSVIDAVTNDVLDTLVGVGFEPRGLAITNDGDGDDLDETLYVTNFLAIPLPGKLDGSDDAKRGKVTVIETATDSIVDFVTLNPLDDTGFKAAGDALKRIPVGPNFVFKTGAYPNQLNNIAIKGNFAYIPSTGDSPNGPVRFDVNTQSLLPVINRSNNQDAGQTINMHLAVAQQTNPVRLFITQPWAMAFENQANAGWVLSAASNIAVKISVDPATGRGTVLKNPADASKVFQIKVGKNPRGIVITSDDKFAFVMNYVSRDVSVMDLGVSPEKVIKTMKSAALPAAGTKAAKIHVGRELYNTSVGEFDPPAPGAPKIVGRMSNNGWGSCASCHPNGLSDNVVWIFPAGPRRTLSQHVDFEPPQRTKMRVLNWSANRDEPEDFESNIRGVSGGLGLIVLADGITPDPEVKDFLPLANGNRKQLKVGGVNAWDALKAFTQFGIRPPISPVKKNDPDVIAGQALFKTAKCQNCHGTAMWSTARVRFTPPPNAAQIVNAGIIAELRQVGTFNANDFNEVRDSAAPPLGADGFVPPTLMSIFAFPQTFNHNGAAATLAQVLQNVTHRSAGTNGVDKLANAADREKVVKFMLSIDAKTPPINP
jgi:YVTN family beta-propeller protein